MEPLPNASTVTVDLLQSLVEQEKMILAREIHDELGGHLIATAMDLASLRRRFAMTDADAVARIDRATHSLNAAVDMMRRVTEELRPTLLDNVGLVAALRWQGAQICQRSNVQCEFDLPEFEPLLTAALAIKLFRIGQEGLVFAENQPRVTHIKFHLTITESLLTLVIHADGHSALPQPGSRGHTALEFLHHRVNAAQGTFLVTERLGGGITLRADVPLDGNG
jgi:signal transduction histidine kinase